MSVSNWYLLPPPPTPDLLSKNCTTKLLLTYSHIEIVNKIARIRKGEKQEKKVGGEREKEWKKKAAERKRERGREW